MSEDVQELRVQIEQLKEQLREVKAAAQRIDTQIESLLLVQGTQLLVQVSHLSFLVNPSGATRSAAKVAVNEAAEILQQVVQVASEKLDEGAQDLRTSGDG